MLYTCHGVARLFFPEIQTPLQLPGSRCENGLRSGNWARNCNFYCDSSSCFSILVQLALFFFTFVNCSSVFLLQTSWSINHLHNFLQSNPLVCSFDLTGGYSNYCLLVSGSYVLSITSIILRPPIIPRMLTPAATSLDYREDPQGWYPYHHIFLKDLMIVYSLNCIFSGSSRES